MKNNKEKGKKTPSVVLIDIETSPLTIYAWQTYDASALKILEPSKIISVSWKELHSNKTHVKCIADYKSYKKGVIDDEELVKEVWEVLDKADVVIAHHGDAFDLKKLNSRFVFHGLNAPSSYQSIDTKKVASKYFKFDSNSLNNLGAYFKVGEKVENGGFPLWVRCIAGEKSAWTLMKKYNAQDVILLEQVYLKLRPYMANHPNLSLFSDESKHGFACPCCSSENVVKRGFAITRTGRKQRYQCNDCGGWSSGPFERNKKVLTPAEDNDD